MEVSYKSTRLASYVGYITQASVNTLAPLLFVMFQRQFGITLSDIAILVSLNFAVQMAADIAAASIVEKIGLRFAAVFSHVCCAAGFILLGTLPFLLESPFMGIIISVVFTAVGGGIIEVVISPIIESLPSNKKAADMSFLHSFYCWGQVAVILISTLYFNTVGIENWMYLSFAFALLPLLNAMFFSRVPLRPITEGGKKTPLKKLFAKKIFLLFLVLMICAGAAEQAMYQWASFFAEAGLGVSKTMGDLLGPCAFALLMGVARTYFGMKGEKLKPENAIFKSAVLCLISYLITVFSPWPVLSLVACALCGLSVAVLWPGTFSLTAHRFPFGGTAMFAVLALAGDVGCTAGPGLVGVVSDAVARDAGSFGARLFSGGDALTAGLRTGLLVASIFALVTIVAVIFIKRNKAAKQHEKSPDRG